MRRLTTWEAVQDFYDRHPGATGEDLAEYMHLMHQMTMIHLGRAVSQEEILGYISTSRTRLWAGGDEPPVPACD